MINQNFNWKKKYKQEYNKISIDVKKSKIND